VGREDRSEENIWTSGAGSKTSIERNAQSRAS
jgi:hypothetical protein